MKGTMPLREDYPLEKFNNLELYYFVSGLLGLGDPGSTPERLYLSFDQNQLDAVPDIKFLFLTQNIIYEDESEKEVVEYYLGKIDRAFDNIEIYQWHFYPHVAPSVSSFQPTLNDYESPSIFRPVSLLKGINRILSEGKFNRRAGNNLFDVKPHVNIPNDIQNQFDFKEIGPLGTNFSGNYFLIVEPEQKKGGVIVNSFQIDILQSQGRLPFDCETVNIHRHFIDGSSVQSYENGEPNSVFT
ncbi:MAG TPA: hypothetical protein VGQ59_07100, partial [Cyclobacteriaceae bacterium]|nr:hypothetical protein [Cyclobacteriaceae bacterium]